MTLTQPTVATRKRISKLKEYQKLYDRSIADPEAFWREESKELHWYYEPHSIFEEDGPGEFMWFSGGRLNAAVNCVDRHAGGPRADKTALLWEGEPTDESTAWTYKELAVQVFCFQGTYIKSMGPRCATGTQGHDPHFRALQGQVE